MSNDDEPVTWKATEWHTFKPQKDITTYELACVLQAMLMRVTPEVMSRLPKLVQRHFEKAD